MTLTLRFFILVFTFLTYRDSFAQNEVPKAIGQNQSTYTQSTTKQSEPTTGQPPTAEPKTFTGKVLEKGTLRPLKQVNVFLLPQKMRATTDDQGAFKFESAIPSNESFQIVINVAGYKKFEKNFDGKENEFKPGLTFYIEKNSYQEYESTLVVKGRNRDDSTRTLKVKEAMLMPGTLGDPIKAIQNLPGVARTNSSQIAIQGSEPKDTRYLIDGHRVPLIFHFGGLSSVVFPELTDRVDLLTAGYGVENGRATGGLVSAVTKTADSDRMKGNAYIDLLNAGGYVEGPLGEGSFALSLRQSYVGQVLKAVANSSSDSNFNFTLAPEFRDLTAIYATKPTEKSEFKSTFLFSQDTLQLLFTQPLENDPNIRGKFENSVQFYRIIPQWTFRFTPENVGRFSFGFGQDQIKNETDENFFRLNSHSLTVKGELENKLNAQWTHFYGFDNEYYWSSVAAKIPNLVNSGGVSNPISTSTTRQIDLTQADTYASLYWRAKYVPENSQWTFSPQIRNDYFKRTKEQTLLSPRFSTGYKVSESLELRGATGLYYQPPEPQEADPTFGNPDIKSPRAIHLSLGFEKDYRGGGTEGGKLSAGVFYKDLDRLVIASSTLVTRNGAQATENYNNEGKGKVAGFEAQYTWDMKPWFFMTNYTLSRSTRTEPNKAEYLARSDQTHNLGLQASYTYEAWRFASRLRYVTGNPYTPILGGSLDTDNDVYIPLRGGFYSQRLPDFIQLDFRADYKWVYDTWILSTYLDIQNITRAANPQGFQYSYDYQQKRDLSLAQFIPSFGLKGEF